MVKIEELPDEPSPPPPPPPPPPSTSSSPLPGPALPPHLEAARSLTPESILADLQKTPLFMQSLDPSDTQNDMIEALKALAYEGEPEEVAANFRAQGNEAFRERRVRDAVEFYGKALAAVRGGKKEGKGHGEVGKKLREIEEACLANRAACNLELKNYRKVLNDCAECLKLNPGHTKAWYRYVMALVALERYPDAVDCLEKAILQFTTTSPSTKLMFEKLLAETRPKLTAQRAQEAKQLEQDQLKRRQEHTLKLALRNRSIGMKSTPNPPDLEDTRIHLEDPMDQNSALFFPALLLYPCAAQTDFVKEWEEGCSPDDVLGGVVLKERPAWDEEGEYDWAGVECFMETATGGLVKVGKKVPLGEVLGGGGKDGDGAKVEVVDGVVRMFVVPKARRGEWVEEWKRKRVDRE